MLHLLYVYFNVIDQMRKIVCSGMYVIVSNVKEARFNIYFILFIYFSGVLQLLICSRVFHFFFRMMMMMDDIIIFTLSL